MKNKIKILAAIIIMVIGVTGCNSNHNKTLNKDKNENSKVETYDFIKYKGSDVGNNSSVGNIISNLPMGEYMSEFALQTNTKPYGVSINYKINKDLDNKNIDDTIEKNAVVLLSLIENAQTIECNMGEKSYKYNRADLETKYGENLKDLFKDNTSIKNFLNM